MNGKEVAAGTPGAKEMNKLKDRTEYMRTSCNPVTSNLVRATVKYADLNGDGKLGNGAGTVEDPGDKEIIGNETPRFEYGIRLGADYKGFDFSIFMQGVGKRQIWGNGFLAIPGYNTADGAIPDAIASDYWTEENTGSL